MKYQIATFWEGYEEVNQVLGVYASLDAASAAYLEAAKEWPERWEAKRGMIYVDMVEM